MEIHCDLAVAVVTASSGGVVPVGLAAGTAWTYASGDWESWMFGRILPQDSHDTIILCAADLTIVDNR